MPEQNRQAGPLTEEEMCVTPEMVQAGVDYFLTLESEEVFASDPAVVVRGICEAAYRAALRFPAGAS